MLLADVTVKVRAFVVIAVSDDGVGLRQTSGGGLGLATVRARLLSRFGPGASLMVEPQESGGVRSAMRVVAIAAVAL